MQTPYTEKMRRTVPDTEAGERLDTYLGRILHVFPSKKSAYKAIKQQHVTVNGQPCAPNLTIAAGDEITVFESNAPTAPPCELDINVVYDDPWLAVVEKPAGVPVMGRFDKSLERALPLYLSPASSEGDALQIPKPVHRLDVPTGGLVLVAKTPGVLTALGRQFQTRQVLKRYRAVVVGKLTGDGTITTPVNGQRAVTEYRAVSHVRSLHTKWITLVDLWLQTGRRHQLRVHMAELGHPITGDKQYGDPKTTMRGKGLFLWSVELAFLHPVRQETVHAQICAPRKFDSYLSREARRWRAFHNRQQQKS